MAILGAIKQIWYKSRQLVLKLNSSDARGARWTRVDLHLHSPAVATFHKPNESDTKTPEGRKSLAKMYAEQLLTAGISIGALTDYNGIDPEWYGLIRDAAGELGIDILPGVELSLKFGKYGLRDLQEATLGGGFPPLSVYRRVFGPHGTMVTLQRWPLIADYEESRAKVSQTETITAIFSRIYPGLASTHITEVYEEVD